MPSLDTCLDPIFYGEMATRAQGFLLLLPEGATGRSAMDAYLTKAYTTSAHPDVHVLSGPDNTPAKIEEVRAALTFAYTHPTAQGLKTLWVPQADALTPQAANAFLKTLEEPSSKTRVIIGASRVERLLPTTKSRCLLLSAQDDHALARAELEEKTTDATPQDLDAALAYTNHTIDAAARLLNAKDGLAWAQKIDATIAKGTLGSVPIGGLQGIDALTFGLVIQTSLAKAMRQNPEIMGPMLDAITPHMSFLERPGIDTALRVRAILRLLNR